MGRTGNEYLPKLSEIVSIARGIVGLVAVIFASGTTAPVSSVIVPPIRPEFSCVKPATRKNSTNKMSTKAACREARFGKTVAAPAMSSGPPACIILRALPLDGRRNCRTPDAESIVSPLLRNSIRAYRRIGLLAAIHRAETVQHPPPPVQVTRRSTVSERAVSFSQLLCHPTDTARP